MSIHKTDCKKILKEITEMRDFLTSEASSESTLKQKFSYLNKNYPAIFSKILSDQSEETYNKCVFMIESVLKVQSGNITQEKASEIVGTDLAEEYVYSKIEGFDRDKHLG